MYDYLGFVGIHRCCVRSLRKPFTWLSYCFWVLSLFSLLSFLNCMTCITSAFCMALINLSISLSYSNLQIPNSIDSLHYISLHLIRTFQTEILNQKQVLVLDMCTMCINRARSIDNESKYRFRIANCMCQGPSLHNWLESAKIYKSRRTMETYTQEHHPHQLRQSVKHVRPLHKLFLLLCPRRRCCCYSMLFLFVVCHLHCAVKFLFLSCLSIPFFG